MSRTLAIGDIHGCLSALRHLWDAVAPAPEDRVIFIGDYVDRGPDSKGVIDFLLALPDELDVTFLGGNHEEKMQLAHMDEVELEHWLARWGGDATLASYGGSFDGVPQEHWDFLRRTQLFVETDTHVFVHANLAPDVPLEAQTAFTMLHKKFDSPMPHLSGKTMVVGHTAQKSHVPLSVGHAVCIDTDPGRGGWLTCLHAETGRYWQATVDGEVREGAIARSG